MDKLFNWCDEYLVHNEELDKHHKTLFDIINRLYQNCVKVDNDVTFDNLLNELASYTLYHFTAEEKYMRDIGYNDIDKQISEHKVFTDRILQLQRDDNLDESSHSKELIVYLGNWLLTHVLEEDMKISEATVG